MFGPETLMSKRDVQLLNPLQLAYLGDSVWELLVRQHLIALRLNVHHMHMECVRLVNAAAQASFLDALQDSLTEEEQSIVLRGRNTHARHPAPRSQSPSDYADATAFETLLGYLYLSNQLDRLRELSEAVFQLSNS